MSAPKNLLVTNAEMPAGLTAIPLRTRLIRPGDDLIALGLQPGKRFREILDAVREAQLNDEIATEEEALRLVNRLLKAPPDRPS